MKKTVLSSILLFALILALCTGCSGNKNQNPSDSPDAFNSGQSGGVLMGQAFNPETDNDNRNAAFIDCAMVDTEDAYYLYVNGYIMYYDKIMEDSGFLCPHPECVHDEKFNNPNCVARASIQLPSMTYYEGKLWWVGNPDMRHIGVFRMNLDGTNKELLHSFELNGDDTRFQGMMLWYFHRGRLFWSSLKQEVANGQYFNTAYFGYMSLEDYEPHDLCERRSFFTPQPTIRFAGDSAYLFIGYDGIGPGDQEIPDGEADLDAYLEWAKNVKQYDEVLRWDPTMDEPETIYLNSEDTCFHSFNDYYVSQEGEIFFRETELEDPDQQYDEENNQYITYINRINGNGEKERIIELTDEDGVHYNMYAMTCGVIVAMDTRYIRGVGDEVRGIWILTFDGRTLYRGELPMKYREKYTDRERVDDNGLTVHISHGINKLHNCWATENEVLFCFTETYYKDSPTHGNSNYYDFVKYEITPNGLIEVPLAECRAHYGDEGW